MPLATVHMIGYGHAGGLLELDVPGTDRQGARALALPAKGNNNAPYIMQPMPVRISSAFFFCSALNAS